MAVLCGRFFKQLGPKRMDRIVIIVALILSTGLTASAGLFELPIATTEGGILNFWPRLNATCEMKPLEDSLCCLDSTFKESSEAHNLLLTMLRRVPHPKYEVQGVAQVLHETSNGLDVGVRYTCDVPLAQDDVNEIPGLGCHRCLEGIAREITNGMSQNVGRCTNSWAVRFGYIYEPDMPWEEDTTWCHLDYWFKVLPADPSTRFWNKFRHELLIRAKSYFTKNYLTYIAW